MLKHLENYRTLIAIILLLILLATFLFWPIHTQQISMLMLLLSIGMTIIFITQKHWQSYQQAEYTREKMTRNLIFDMLGLLLTLGAAMYAGWLAGNYFGLRTGFWIGLVAGFVGGFVVAWIIRSVWEKLVGRWHTSIQS